MNKYLVKIAEKTKEKSSWNNPGHIVGGILLGGTAAAPMKIGANALGKNIRRMVEMPSSDIADRHTVKHFMRKNNFNKSNLSFDHIRTGKSSNPFENLRRTLNNLGGSTRNPAYVDKHLSKTINSVSSKIHKDIKLAPDFKKNHIQGLGGKGINHTITMHELGHAKDFNTGAVKLKRGLAYTNAGLALGGGALTAAMLSNEKTQDYAPLVPAAQMGIHLRQEGAANYHAYKGIKAHKGAKAANKFLTKVVPPQMGNYTLGLGAGVAGAYAASKLIKHFKKLENKKD